MSDKKRRGTRGGRRGGAASGRSPARSGTQAVVPALGIPFKPSWVAALAAIFAVSLAIRLPTAFRFGFGLDGPGTFRIINYDESASCKAQLGHFAYSSFVGKQTALIARLFGQPPPQPPISQPRGLAYCYGPLMISIERVYSAVTGSLTVVLLGLFALILWPERPEIAWSAASLLGFSNFHIAESHWATVDAPQTFFFTLLSTLLAYGIASGRRWPFVLSPLAAVSAVWVKYNWFALAAYACLFRELPWKRHPRVFLAGLLGLASLVALYVHRFGLTDYQIHLLWGYEYGKWGMGFGHIGTWRRWIRNLTNIPIVHFVGLGTPACLFVWLGLKKALRDDSRRRLWLTLAPALAYVVYMAVLAPRTYYRHYLPLFPTVAILAAYGFWESRVATRALCLFCFALYPLFLTMDSELNYWNDPRYALRTWYQSHPGVRTLCTYYVVPPPGMKAALFDMEKYSRLGPSYLSGTDFVILSENWYDTSFPNELNGPIAWNPEWLVLTQPLYAFVYRLMLAGGHPNLTLEAEFNLRHFTPEFLVHRYFYGSFQLFIGDLKIFRVKPSAGT
jgi:hypothetical protein